MKRGLFRLAIALVCFLSLAPLLWQFLTSIKPDADITRLPPLLPARATWDHYRFILAEGLFLKVMLNSFIVAAGSTFLSLAAGTMAGFALARLEFGFKAALLFLLLAVSMFPPIATVSPLFLLIRAAGLRDTLTALILTHAAHTLPLATLVMANFVRSMPLEVYRAALVDGCTPFAAFRLVVLPAAGPGLVSTGILAFIFSWNEFLYALTFTATTASRTIPVAIALFPGLHRIPWGEIAAASVTVTLPLLALVLIFQNRIAEGLSAGAVKG